MASVGVDGAVERTTKDWLDAVAADSALFSNTSMSRLKVHATVSGVPIIAVSLTRNAAEARLSESSGVAGFSYLPTLGTEDARRVLAVARQKIVAIHPPSVLEWPEATQAAGYR